MNVDKGYVEADVDPRLDLVEEIKRLKEEKGAVVMAHYYQPAEIQDLADYVGDSLALARIAETTTARLIVLCGVHFMGETAKILNPEKTVVVPDLNAGCSLADSCPADEFAAFVAAHPGHTVISYVNTSAAVKAVSDMVVTSGNARKIVESYPADEKIIFGPDRNLGSYINGVTGRQMLLWDGACHVHERFSAEKILKLREEHPEAKILVHPECPKPLRLIADVIGSTAVLLDAARNSSDSEFIVATEPGILHKMRRECPSKTFYAAPGDDVTCACNECSFMKLTTLKKLYLSLLYEQPAIEVNADIAERARRPIVAMLERSK